MPSVEALLNVVGNARLASKADARTIPKNVALRQVVFLPSNKD